MANVIKNCTKCSILKHNISEKPPMKHITPEGPHYRYQADLWELDKNIAEKLNYKYILEIKDCFSKFLMCYPLKNKNAESILNYIKNFFYHFRSP